MKKLIITERQYKVIENHLHETIKPEEAYTNKDAIQTVIDKKRPVGFLAGATADDLLQVTRGNLEYIWIGKKNRAYVIYNQGAEEQAQQLAAIARKNGGYLPINTPEETYIIGKLLGYDETSVKLFVLNKFPDFKFY